MLRCLAVGLVLPFLFTLCGPRVDPNLNKDKRGLAIQLVQQSPGADQKHKIVDFATQEVNFSRASGKKIVDYGWSAEVVSGSQEMYNVRFSYKEDEVLKEAIWSADIVTKEVRAKTPLARKLMF